MKEAKVKVFIFRPEAAYMFAAPRAWETRKQYALGEQFSPEDDDDKKGYMQLCMSELGKLFDIPEDTKKIYVTVSNKRLPNAQRIRPCEKPVDNIWASSTILVNTPGGEVELEVYTDVWRVLNKLKKAWDCKSFYVAIEV